MKKQITFIFKDDKEYNFILKFYEWINCDDVIKKENNEISFSFYGDLYIYFLLSVNRIYGSNNNFEIEYDIEEINSYKDEKKKFLNILSDINNNETNIVPLIEIDINFPDYYQKLYCVISYKKYENNNFSIEYQNEKYIYIYYFNTIDDFKVTKRFKNLQNLSDSKIFEVEYATYIAITNSKILESDANECFDLNMTTIDKYSFFFSGWFES